MVSDQLMLFDIPAKLLHRPPRVLLHLADAGYVDGTGDVAQWWCSRCGHETDWQPEPATRARPPCPRVQHGERWRMSDQRPEVPANGSGGGVQIQRKEVSNGTGRISAPFP